MKHEKIIIDQRGKIIITVTLVTFSGFTDREGNFYRYDVLTTCALPGTRKQKSFPGAISAEEELQAKLELWENIKPR